MTPKFLFVETNKRCNLRCNHCDFWKRDDSDAENYLSVAQLEDIATEFKALGGTTLVICGGEPMLDEERYFGICDIGRKLELRVCSVVNGTRIQNQKQADAVLWKGPTEISISYDDFREVDHDYFRGVKGSWKMCNKAIQLLVGERSYRLAKYPDVAQPMVIVMGLIHGGNYLELPRFYDFVLNELGADKLKLNFLQPSFGTNGIGEDPFFWKYSHIDPARLSSVLAQCESLFGFKYREPWVEDVLAYVKSIQGRNALEARAMFKGWGSGVELQNDLCNSYERNIMLGHYGDAGICFSDCIPRVRVTTGSELRAWWESSVEGRSKIQGEGCRRLCGISHSVRREKCYV